MGKRAASSGIEGDRPEEITPGVGDGERVVRVLRLPTQHHRLTQVILSDVTDRHSELVQENEWRCPAICLCLKIYSRIQDRFW